MNFNNAVTALQKRVHLHVDMMLLIHSSLQYNSAELTKQFNILQKKFVFYFIGRLQKAAHKAQNRYNMLTKTQSIH